MSEKEFVEVTVKVPKPILELFQAFKQLTQGHGPAFESWLWDTMIISLKGDLDELDPDNTFGIKGEKLMKIYGIEKVVQYTHKDP